MDKNYRIHTNINSDTLLNVNMRQDFDFIEVLSLKLRQVDAYKLHSSNYGVIVGRVLANDAFGIPNARVSVFVERDDNDSSLVESFYPYVDITTRDKDGRRYNTLPDYSDDDCYRVVGTFPNKRLVLDDDTQLEIYDKYWKYSTVTNGAGDYMIFGIPSGNQQIHVDIDLSDIGILSQKPTDFIHKGYNLSMFDSPRQFKESTNLDGLAQIFSQNKSVFVYPFWGDADNGIAAITRSDIQIQYKFEPTCVFMGSIVSDNEAHSINHKCAADIDNGMNNQLVAGEGNIEMIRKTPDGLVEEYQVQTGESLIDTNGVWCYQIPMNLDFVGTDEYGNIVPTDDPTKGVPTRARVRFRVSKNETGDEGFSRHTAKYLVPMNPIFSEDDVAPTIKEKGSEIEKMYNFGSSTPESCFRDLYWNNVYSVKNFIPKVQVAHRAYSKNYSALKGSNLVENQNPIPFNKLRFDLPFVYMVLCIVFTIMLVIVSILNGILGFFHWLFNDFCFGPKRLFGFKIPSWLRCPFYAFGWVMKKMFGAEFSCISLGSGLSGEDKVEYFPGCWGSAVDESDCSDDSDCKKVTSGSELKDKIQQNLANEFKIVKLDFYQDWLNGCLYMPLWYWRKRKKKTFLGITISRAKNQYCSCDTIYNRMKTFVTCSLKYLDNSFSNNDALLDEGQKKWHKKVRDSVRFNRGLIKQVENKDGLNVYYYSALQAVTSEDATNDPKMKLSDRENFKAVRLYATDIILLGNLNTDNLYGIPQLFTALPSTTANIPPIATISEPESERVNETEKETDNDAAYSEDSGVTITTGMDWGNDKNAKKDKPKFSKGLFMDLACTYTNTKAKSCINVERLSELGVNLDTNYFMPFSKDSKLDEGPIESDGFITKYELDDMENRAMFATLNHIGFIPQTYQDMYGFYHTQIQDENTGYFVPKFKYIYPVDFDGRMQPIMTRYKNKFSLSQYDDADESYITFRLGAESGTKNSNSEGRMRHFYKDDANNYSMPLYNNSFYFYFGINKGNTAIDKFNKLFYSQCFTNSKNYFTLNHNEQGKSFCPEMRIPTTDGYPFIEVISDDIQIPYSYRLFDMENNLVIMEDEMQVDKFVIGGYYNNGVAIANGDGKIKFQRDNNSGTQIMNNNELSNQIYTLELIDGNGKSIKERVKLDMDKISIDYDTVALGTKFYNEETSNIEYICNDKTQFYGKILINYVYIDGLKCTINSASCGYDTQNQQYIVNAMVGKDGKISSNSVTIILKSIDVDDTKDCMCDQSNNPTTSFNRTNYSISPTDNPFYFKFEEGTIKFYVYQPSRFMTTIRQDCSEENVTYLIINVENGENFNTYLNEMPTRFIIGTNEDNKDMDIANGTMFYSNEHVRSLLDDGVNSRKIQGWFKVHDEEGYSFSTNINKAIEQNEDIWSDFVDFSESITEYSSKAEILKYKFSTMFSLSDAVYVNGFSDGQFTFTSTGGLNPILYRAVYPYYTNEEKLSGNTTYLYQDTNNVVLDKKYPNIVGENYDDKSLDRRPRFNQLYGTDAIGNYFAAFTNNGGYTSNTSVEDSLMVVKQPNYSVVNAKNGVIKRLGKDEEGKINEFSLATDSTPNTKPHLRAMFIDRRFDFDFIVFGPMVGTTFNLYEEGNEDKENVWKSARISGITYNGIEMAYDEDYNIISANVNYDSDDNPISAYENDTLEYSYRIIEGDNDAMTKYNYHSSTMKQPYEAYINNIDIRKLFWSKENHPIEPTNSPYHLFNHESNIGNKYNDVFNLDNYPTKRLIDIGSLKPSSRYEFEYISCSYATAPTRNNRGEITMKAKSGDSNELEFSFSQPISFMPPNADSTDYGNALYERQNGQFVCTALSLSFSFTQATTNDDFDVVTRKPSVINVLPLYNGIDGISYIKTANEDEGLTLEDALNSVKNSAFNDWEMTLPAGVDYNGDYPKIDDELVLSDDVNFTNIIFKKEAATTAKVFTILVERDFINNTGDFLKKHVKTYEFSDLYDIRNIAIDADSNNSYVGFMGYSTETSSQGQGGSSTKAGGTTSAYTQTISFTMPLSNDNCQVFNSFDMMSFTFAFYDANGGIYKPSNVNVSKDDNLIRFKVIWTQDMSYLADNSKWASDTNVVLYAKTPSNFTYKIPFKIRCVGGQTLPSGQGETQTTNITIV